LTRLHQARASPNTSVTGQSHRCHRAPARISVQARQIESRQIARSAFSCCSALSRNSRQPFNKGPKTDNNMYHDHYSSSPMPPHERDRVERGRTSLLSSSRAEQAGELQDGLRVARGSVLSRSIDQACPEPLRRRTKLETGRDKSSCERMLQPREFHEGRAKAKCWTKAQNQDEVASIAHAPA
jgi:hypothetical protein